MKNKYVRIFIRNFFFTVISKTHIRYFKSFGIHNLCYAIYVYIIYVYTIYVSQESFLLHRSSRETRKWRYISRISYKNYKSLTLWEKKGKIFIRKSAICEGFLVISGIWWWCVVQSVHLYTSWPQINSQVSNIKKNIMAYSVMQSDGNSLKIDTFRESITSELKIKS